MFNYFYNEVEDFSVGGHSAKSYVSSLRTSLRRAEARLFFIFNNDRFIHSRNQLDGPTVLHRIRMTLVTFLNH